VTKPSRLTLRHKVARCASVARSSNHSIADSHTGGCLFVVAQRCSDAAQFLDDWRDCDIDACDADEAEPLRHAGFANLGNICFINATLQMLLRLTLRCAPDDRDALLPDTLSTCAFKATLRAALGLSCNHKGLNVLLCLPRGFGWRLGTSKETQSLQEDALAALRTRAKRGGEATSRHLVHGTSRRGSHTQTTSRLPATQAVRGGAYRSYI
jgi:hypothetical protein